LIAKFLSAGPCQDAARTLENELKQHVELLPHTITYEGKKLPMTMERLVNNYLSLFLSSSLSLIYILTI
jgi:hypothetical protein